MSERGLALRRILVALDASPSSEAALEAAAELASVLGAELSGLYVEDVDLLRIAELPLARTVGSFSGTARRLDSEDVERALRAAASRMRMALETAASKARINWSFQVARGTVATEMLAAASEADLLALGKSGWTAHPEGRLGSTVRAMVSAGSGPVLILQPGARLGTPVLAVYDGSAAARKALEFAAWLLPEEDGGFSVLIAANDAETARTLEKQAGEWAERRRINVRFRTLLGGRVPELVQALGTEDAGLLVLPGPFLSATAGALPAILSRIERPALLVW